MPLFGEPGFARALSRAYGPNPAPRRFMQMGAEVFLGIPPGQLGETIAGNLGRFVVIKVGTLAAVDLTVQAIGLAHELGVQADRLTAELDREEAIARELRIVRARAAGGDEIIGDVSPMWLRDP